ncbi:MAG TPA: VOC family protein [bacterium]|nr:VOC family protein [bacterium]
MMPNDNRAEFRKIDHIGVVVESLAEAHHWLGEIFGLPVLRRIENPVGKIRGVFYACGDIAIEVLEIGDPELRRQRLGTGTRARIEHIAVEVDKLHAALAALSPLGVRTTLPEPRRSADTLSMWTIAETTGGISYQLMEKGRAPDTGGSSSGSSP